MFMVTIMCGPKYINGIIFMSKAFRKQSGVKKSVMSLPFFNDNNSENFYQWCDNMYHKCILNNEIERSIKTFRHGTSNMVSVPINFKLPNGSNTPVRAIMTTFSSLEDKIPPAMRRAAACADYSITGTAMLDIKGRRILFSNGVFEKLHREAIKTIKDRVDGEFEEETVIKTLLGSNEELLENFFANIMKKEKWEGRAMLAPPLEAGKSNL